ncbi:MAG: hypothetical protein ACO34E_00285 [Limisphaerales bacterium]|jgi:hypothetical protein
MRTKRYLDSFHQTSGRLIAAFGSAQLVRTEQDHLEVQGGTQADRQEARLWALRFLRKQVVDCGR